MRGAAVVLHQLVDGERTLELGRTTTADDGAWSLPHDGYEHVEIEIIGGSYTEASGGAVTLDAGTVLLGVAMDLRINEQRTDVTISPWTHLAVTLGRARWSSGSKEPTYPAAIATAISRLASHLGFDPTRTPIAPLTAAAGSPTEPVKYALSLGGLSEMAALAASELGATVQDVNTVELTKVLSIDAASSEALFDGNGDEPLHVGASCPPPVGCSAEGPGCYATCAVHTNSLRARLGGAVLSFLLTPDNGTTLTRDDVNTWLEGMRGNIDPELFGPDATEPFDSIGPTITWVAPADGATVAGSVAIEVTAFDPVGVASITVTAGTASPMPITDTDPAPERFAASFSTISLPEGSLTLTANATDTETRLSESARDIVINNVAGGTVSGVVYKGRVGGAAVRVFALDASGVQGAMLGQGSTQSDGSFTNILIADGYSGALLIEAGTTGTYSEESATATVTLDVEDRLRTIVPAYTDGSAPANLSVTPLTSFAVTYLQYLQSTSQGGATLAARWATARSTIEAHFGVANIYDLTPLAPAEMGTFNAPARYGLVLVGLSERARISSTLGGGDGGTFGSAMTSMRVTRVLELDLADGCWDGRQGTAQLQFGGTQALTTHSARRDLANAIAAYLTDGARNQTPYAGAADVLGQLDTLSNGGGNPGPGSCSATGRVNPDAGGSFDQMRPTVAFLGAPLGATPPAGFVRGVITVDALADDDLDNRPTLRFIAPMGTPDADGDETDPDARHTFDTTQRPDGPLVVTLEAVDDAGNVSDPALSTRTFIVDNTGPVITIGGVIDDGWYAVGPVVTYSVNEPNLASVTATLDGLPFSSGGQVSAIGMHTLVVNAQDQAGATASRSVTFYVDPIAPTLALGLVTPSGSVVRQTLSITATADDNLKMLGSLGTAITVSATSSAGPITPASATPSVLGDQRRQLIATFDTTAAPDGPLTVRFSVADEAGNAATELVVTRTIDNTLPTVNVNVTPDAWYASPPTVTFSQTDANPGTTTALLDGVAFAGGAVTAEGRHVLVVTATDAAGNVRPHTVTFYVDLTNPVLTANNTLPAWISGPVTVRVTADDTMKTFGSLPSDIAVTATGPGGAVSLTPGPTTLADGRRQVEVTVDTTAIDDAAGGGTLTLRFDITDRSGRAASQLVIARPIDNAPPVLTFAGFPFGDADSGWTAAAAPDLEITGSVADGSPTTVSLTVGAFGTFAATVAGNVWSYKPASTLPGGEHTLTAVATDSAGNMTSRTYRLKVDRTAPVLTLLPSTVLDERNCDVAVNVNPGSTPAGVISNPAVNYGACNANGSGSVSLDTVTAATEIGKFTNRLTAQSGDNPLVWHPQANDGIGGVGVGQGGTTIQFRVYRTGQPPPAWQDTTNAQLMNGILEAQAFVTAAAVPETATHTAAFTVELRATDRLGNTHVSGLSTLTRSWTHRPLAPPVLVRYVGLTNPADAQLGEFSLFKHSLTPTGSQVGLAGAMTSGVFQADAPRGWYEFEVWNPHTVPINVGFYVPSFGGASYATRVWEVNPYINNTLGIVNDPSGGTCGWPSRSTVFRMTGGSAPFTCGGGTTCTCLPGPLTDSIPAATTGTITASMVRIVAWDATPAAPVRLAPLSLTPSLDGSTFYEFTIPGRDASSNVARRLRMMVALPNLDLFSPADDVTNQSVLESDGSGFETHVYRQGSDSIQPVMTAVMKERWADCRAYNAATNNCTDMHARRRLRATVQVNLSLPMNSIVPRVRSRAVSAATASPEPIPDLLTGDGELRATTAVSWASCETGFPFTCPTIPDYTFGVAF